MGLIEAIIELELQFVEAQTPFSLSLHLVFALKKLSANDSAVESSYDLIFHTNAMTPCLVSKHDCPYGLEVKQATL
jgi:hypothetical protein